MKTKALLSVIIMSAMLISFVAAEPAQTVTYNNSNPQGLTITQLNYQPYPANPGEYVDVWVEAQFYGQGFPSNATFTLEPSYPFSLDPNESAIQSFGSIVSATPMLIHYKVRIDQNAVPGDNYLTLTYSPDGGNNIIVTKQLDIQINNAETSFGMVIQDSSSTGTSLGIANTGENTANALIVRIPPQPDFRVVGTNGQIVGNLNSGDYTIATFDIIPTGQGGGNKTLEVELDYTDAIGVRRTVFENISYNFATSAASSISPGTASASGNGVYFSSNGGNSTGYRTANRSIFSKALFWIAVAAILLIAGIIAYTSRKKKRGPGEKTEKSRDIKDNSKVPDWVLAERKKK